MTRFDDLLRTLDADPQFEAGNARGLRTKRQIVEKAAEAFRESGFDGTSIRSIAREVGIDHRTLAHHFGSKEELLTAVLQWRDWDGAVDWLNVDEFNAQSAADMVAAQARRNVENPELTQLFSLILAEAAREDHPAREYMQERHDLLSMALALMVAPAGGTSPEGYPSEALADLSPHERVVILLSTWDGLQTYSALHPGDVDPVKLLGRVLELTLGFRPTSEE